MIDLMACLPRAVSRLPRSTCTSGCCSSTAAQSALPMPLLAPVTSTRRAVRGAKAAMSTSQRIPPVAGATAHGHALLY
eukprot:scaffold836_cov123-Isochrysis_galbana.AAC.5